MVHRAAGCSPSFVSDAKGEWSRSQIAAGCVDFTRSGLGGELQPRLARPSQRHHSSKTCISVRGPNPRAVRMEYRLRSHRCNQQTVIRLFTANDLVQMETALLGLKLHSQNASALEPYMHILEVTLCIASHVDRVGMLYKVTREAMTVPLDWNTYASAFASPISLMPYERESQSASRTRNVSLSHASVSVSSPDVVILHTVSAVAKTGYEDEAKTSQGGSRVKSKQREIQFSLLLNRAAGQAIDVEVEMYRSSGSCGLTVHVYHVS